MNKRSLVGAANECYYCGGQIKRNHTGECHIVIIDGKFLRLLIAHKDCLTKNLAPDLSEGMFPDLQRR